MSSPFTHILVTVPYGSLTREQETTVRDLAQRLADELRAVNERADEAERHARKIEEERDVALSQFASRPERGLPMLIAMDGGKR